MGGNHAGLELGNRQHALHKNAARRPLDLREVAEATSTPASRIRDRKLCERARRSTLATTSAARCARHTAMLRRVWPIGAPAAFDLQELVDKLSPTAPSFPSKGSEASARCEIKATMRQPRRLKARAMIGLIFLATAFAFVILATLAAVSTTSASRAVSDMANKVVNGCSAAALILLALTAWFNYWPPA